ncbi:hypothetical protein ACFPVT_08520 [Corynebacterium choanae]|uniref:hypothetical protein n=1 Tax=Corynebacterium choanae TaxID=1862358 RepID=UPI0019CFBF1E|nr:hypothetical protein [Corynebacterium choanae]
MRANLTNGHGDAAPATGAPSLKFSDEKAAQPDPATDSTDTRFTVICITTTASGDMAFI